MSSSVIDLVSDDDEASQDDIQHAIALSLADMNNAGGGSSGHGDSNFHSTCTSKSSQDGGGSSSSGGSSGVGGGSCESPAPTSDGGSAGPTLKRQRVSIRPTQQQPHAMAPLFRQNPILMKGALGCAETVTFQDVMRGEWSQAFLWNFNFDVNWLVNEVSRLDSSTDNAEVMLIGGSCRSNIKKALDEAAGAYYGRSFVAAVPGYGSHHTKMAIMVFPTGVRICIPTANYTQSDWTKKAQAVWWQEFPYKSAQTGSATAQRLGNGSNNDNDFGEVLCDYIRQTVYYTRKSGAGDSAPGSSSALLLDLAWMLEARVDFSAARVMLVTSTPGSYEGADMRKYGHMRVRDILEKEPLPTSFLPPQAMPTSPAMPAQTPSTAPAFPRMQNLSPHSHSLDIRTSVVNKLRGTFNIGAARLPTATVKPVHNDLHAVPETNSYSTEVVVDLTESSESKEKEVRTGGKRKLHASASADASGSSCAVSISNANEEYTHANGYAAHTHAYTSISSFGFTNASATGAQGQVGISSKLSSNGHPHINMNSDSVGSGTSIPSTSKKGKGKAQASTTHNTSGVLIPGGKKGIPLPKDLRVVCQCSSFGSLNDDWLNALAVSFTTFAGCEERAVIPTTQKGRASAAKNGKGKLEVGGSPLYHILQVIWPSVEFVRTCIEGWTGGITVPAPAKNVLEPVPGSEEEFQLQCKRSLQPIFHTYTGLGVRSDVIPHIKSYYLYRPPAGPHDNAQLAWLLVGSHNMSNPAFGKLVTDGTKLNIDSYEMSIMFLPSQLMRPDTSEEFTVDPFGLLYPKLFTYGGLSSSYDLEEDGLPFDLLPLPYPLPPTPYPHTPCTNPHYSSVPWCSYKKFEGKDRRGKTWSQTCGRKWDMQDC